MNPSPGQSSSRGPWRRLRPWLFPVAIAGLYALAFALAPDKADEALRSGLGILKKMAGPICLALVLMTLLSRWLSPAHISRYMGQSAGLRGVVLSSVAGFLSMGPIYAWYPLFATMKAKGASAFHVANFICCRSIKPVLLPVMVAYLGWTFTVGFVLATYASALLSAGIVSLSAPWTGR